MRSFVTGGTVLDVMQEYHAQSRRLPEKLIWHYFRQACYAVHELHHLDPPVAHRDIKVENLLLQEDRRSAVLCDFGSCTTRAQAYTRPQDIASETERIEKYTTPHYRAPEMVDLHSRVVVDHRVDVWALGCLLYKLCFFRTPFEDSSGECAPFCAPSMCCVV